jgi:plasmid stability protein
MPSVQMRNVPAETHAVLRQRAAAAHQSLQEYLRARLIAEASEPTLEEVLDRAAGRSGRSGAAAAGPCPGRPCLIGGLCSASRCLRKAPRPRRQSRQPATGRPGWVLPAAGAGARRVAEGRRRGKLNRT